MSSQGVFAIDVETIYGSRLQFRNANEIRDFLSREREAWDWVLKSPVNEMFSRQLSNHIRSQYSAIEQHIPAFDGGNAAPVTAALRTAYNSQRILLSDAPLAEFVGEMSGESRSFGAAVLCAWVNLSWINMGDYDQFRAVFALVAFDAKIGPRTHHAVKRSLNQALKSLADVKAEVEKETVAQRAAFRQSEDRIKRVERVIGKLSKRRGDRFQAAKDHDVAEAIERIRETEALYREKMQLKAPVDYWTDKAEVHRNNALDHRWNLVLFATFGSISVVLALILITKYATLFAIENAPAGVYLSLATLGIAITTMAFWAARILTRLFLSEHHLSIDAQERAIMAKTYLALTADGAVDEKERSLVLASLFRPTTDGIVKDDAAPDLTPAAVASRILTR